MHTPTTGTVRERGGTDSPASPVATNVSTPAPNSASGTCTARPTRRRHASTAPASAASATGGRAASTTKDTNEPGTSLRPRLRSSSSARSLVACSENSGSPVTHRSTPAQMSGADTASESRSSLSPRRAGGHAHHSQYAPARTHASGRRSPAIASSAMTGRPRRGERASIDAAHSTIARNGTSTYARAAYRRNAKLDPTNSAPSSPGQRPKTASPTRYVPHASTTSESAQTSTTRRSASPPSSPSAAHNARNSGCSVGAA